MHTGLEEHPDGARRLVAFYAERAAASVALIVTDCVSPSPEGVVMAGALVLTHTDQLHHRIITEAVHQGGNRPANTACRSLQISA